MDARKFIRSLLRLAEALAFQRAWRIQPEDLRILEVPDRSDASRYHRRRVKKKKDPKVREGGWVAAKAAAVNQKKEDKVDVESLNRLRTLDR